MENKELMEQYLKERGFKKARGYAINTQEMNPEEFDEIVFEGDSLQDAIEGYYRVIEEYWIYEPSDYVQIFEEIEEAIDYAEEESDVTFEKYKEENENRKTKIEENIKNNKSIYTPISQEFKELIKSEVQKKESGFQTKKVRINGVEIECNVSRNMLKSDEVSLDVTSNQRIIKIINKPVTLRGNPNVTDNARKLIMIERARILKELRIEK